jgi:hypothetical protein
MAAFGRCKSVRTHSFIHPHKSNLYIRDDLVLYTITVDSVLRIFMPVLDSQRYLQLHEALDEPFVPRNSSSKGKEKAKENTDITTDTKTNASTVFWLDRKVVGDALKKVLEQTSEDGEEGEARRRRAREVIEEGWDLFLRVMSDGSVLVTAVAVSSSYIYIP